MDGLKATGKQAKLVVIRGPQGISTANSGKLLNLINSYRCETHSEEFNKAWEALCIDKYGEVCELIGITYAD